MNHPWITPQKIVGLWILGFIGSFAIQSLLQSWFAGVTLWGSNVGWQTEIAIWNIGMIGVLIPIYRDAAWSRKVIPGLIVLSLAFGLNHLQAFVRADVFQLGNLLGFLFNFFAFILGILTLKTAQTKRTR